MVRVPKEIFLAYLKAGCVWPQLRGSLVCGACAACASIDDIGALLGSSLTEDQLRQVTTSAERLHTRFQVEIDLRNNVEAFQDEWTKTLNAIAFVLLLATDQNFYGQYVATEDYSIPSARAQALFRTMDDQAKKRLQMAFTKANAVFMAERDLAALFRLTFAPPTLRQLLFSPDGMMRSPMDIVQHPSALRISCIEMLKSRISTQLVNTVPPRLVECLAMGLEHSATDRSV